MKTKLSDADSLPHETGGAAFLPNNIGDAAFLPQNNINDFRQECRNSYQFLEKNQYVHIWGTNLPHWHQDGKTQFVTFRLADSIPQSKIEELKVYKQEWMKAHPFPWSQEVQEEYNHNILVKCDRWIDAGYGSCILKRPDIRKIVEDALLFYDGKRYIIHCYVIMPNHVHVLLTPIDGHNVTSVFSRVKGFSAHSINKVLGQKGTIWQPGIFDRIVRNLNNFLHYIVYIQNNPQYLDPDEYTLGGAAFLPQNDNNDFRQECRNS